MAAQVKNRTLHPKLTSQEYKHLQREGYTVAEMKRIWERQAHPVRSVHPIELVPYFAPYGR